MSETRTAEATEHRWFDALTAAARAKLNAPADWAWYNAKVIGGERRDSLLEGGVPNKRLDGKPRSGPAKWKGVVGEYVVVTQAEVDEARAIHERTTGRCGECDGCGNRIHSVRLVSRGKSERTYKPCERCNGTGRAALPSTPEADQ